MKITATKVFATRFEGQTFSFRPKKEYEVPSRLGKAMIGAGLMEPVVEKKSRRSEPKPEPVVEPAELDGGGDE